MSETLRKYGAKYNTTFCSLCGLSTDTKPTGSFDGVGIANGSEFIEMDTGKKYMYDAESSVWNEVSSGGGGGSTLIEKSITANGEYNASDDSADGYSKVTVDVPNTYTAQDEGKVVDNGALVAQTTHAEITENGTYDITTNNSVSVNVSGGGVEFSDDPTSFTLLKNIRNLDVVIPNGCTSIDASAFSECKGLKSVEIPSTITSISAAAFKRCTSLENITIPTSVTTISNNAFQECNSLKTVEIPSGVTAIADFLFDSCSNLENVILPNTITSIGQGAFSNCSKLKTAEIPSSVTSIGQNAFNRCTLLENITIPSNITSIASSSFYACQSLVSLEIPSNVTSIASYAFYYYTGLQSVKFTSQTPPTIANSNAFGSLPINCIIYVPQGSLSAYTSAAKYPNPNTYTYIEY